MKECHRSYFFCLFSVLQQILNTKYIRALWYLNASPNAKHVCCLVFQITDTNYFHKHVSKSIYKHVSNVNRTISFPRVK